MGKSVRVALGIVASLLVCVSSAHAINSNDCVPTSVGWQGSTPSTARILYFTCDDGNTYLAYTGSTVNANACNTDLDSLKVLESMATTALLSGHALSVFWNQQSCQNGSSRIFQALALLQ